MCNKDSTRYSCLSEMYPAQRITGVGRRVELADWYWSWFSALPIGHLKMFIEKGLRPFLRKHGYELIQPTSKCCKAVSTWAFSHVQVEHQKSKDYVPILPVSVNTDCEEEWDVFCLAISYEEWTILCDEWFADEFLDNSDAGLAQRNELPYFVWRIVYLDSSPTHHKWLDNMAIQEQADEEIYGIVYVPEEQSQAFGGDRRTL
jgi:hypothetical protein